MTHHCEVCIVNHTLHLTEFATNAKKLIILMFIQSFVLVQNVSAVRKKSVFCYYNRLRGRKQKMFLTIKEKIEAKTFDPNLSLLSPLLDPPHFGKSIKASFSNCMSKLFDEKGCLSFLHTLRNKSGEEKVRAMRKLVPKNDHVKNKDRQEPVAV